MVDPTIIKMASTQACSIDNITLMRGKLIKFHEIRNLIYANIRDARMAKGEAAFYNNMLFGLQMVKATCDVIINVAGELPAAGKVVKRVYGAAQPVAELGGKAWAGQTITTAELARTGNAVIGAGLSHRLGDSPFADLAANQKLKADVVINATARDMEGVMFSLAEYQAQLADWAIKTAKSLGGKESLPLISAGVDVIKAGYAYKQAYDDWKKGDMGETFDAGVAMSQRQLTQISTKIAEVERALNACGYGKPQTMGVGSLPLLSGRPTGPTIRAGR